MSINALGSGVGPDVTIVAVNITELLEAARKLAPVILSRTGIDAARVQTGPSTVVQTSRVASENCSFMTVSIPPAQRKSPLSQ
jgi:hypothetical protein